MCGQGRRIWSPWRLDGEDRGEHTAQALILIETTVAPATTEQVAYPVVKKIFRTARHRRGTAARPQLRAG